VADLLYRTPPAHRTHHDPTFDLSAATFTFDTGLVKRMYRKRIATYDAAAKRFMVGPGHRREREAIANALKELSSTSDTEDLYCSETIAATFANAMGDSVYDRFTTVHCVNCNADYGQRSVTKTGWLVDNGDGSGSSGWKLVCPKQHVLYASINSVTD